MFDNSDDDFHRLDYRNLPVFIKAEEILHIVITLSSVTDPAKDEIKILEHMLEEACKIPAKIASAVSEDAYSVQFDNATIIKLAARELQNSTSLLLSENLCNEKYIHVLRQTIEEFRILFLEWVSTFNKENDEEDEWDIKRL